MPERSADSRREALNKFMADRKLKAGPWAKSAGIPAPTLYGFLNGSTDDMGTGVYEALASAAGASVDQLLGHTDDVRDQILATIERLLQSEDYTDITVPLVCQAAQARQRAIATADCFPHA